MALTADDLVSAFETAGVTDVNTLVALLASANLSLQRVMLQTAVAKAQAEQRDGVAASEAKIQDLNQQIAKVESDLAALLK
jgi:hypothetical protein